MKFKALLSLTAIIATSLFSISCDDNISTIGGGIQPEGDNITMVLDSVFLTAETVNLDEGVYLRTNGALLGMLDDPIMGKTKAEFLTNFFCTNGTFEGDDGKAQIDSVFFSLSYLNSAITGDSLSTMGIRIYDVDKKDLASNFYTNIKPSDYSSMQTIWGQRYFTHTALDKAYSNTGKQLYIEMDKSFGEKLYNAWVEGNKVNKNIFETPETLKKVLKGIYVTSDFNNKALIEASDASIQMRVLIFYSYEIKKVGSTIPDSTVTRYLPLEKALQINSITSTPGALPTEKETGEDGIERFTKSYVKSPAGVVTKITIPLAEIRKRAKEQKEIGNSNYMVSSAVFSMTGMTEEEEKLSITNRPDAMLFINKDHYKDFILDNKIEEVSAAVKIMFRHKRYDTSGNVTGSNNTYHFNVSNTTSLSNNISSLINYYLDKEKDLDEAKKTKELEYYLIPIDYRSTANSNTGAYNIDMISNKLAPSAAIFRTQQEYMKMSLIFGKYSEIKK